MDWGSRWLLMSLLCGSSLACAASVEPDASSGSGSESTSESESSSEAGTSESESEASESETGETGEPEPEGNLLLSDAQLNIAHRGGARLRPEDTLVAFEHALEIGADVIEFDLHGSADGRVVIIHDSTVDRTTEGTGNVRDLSFAELRELDAGYQFSPDGGETHPWRGIGVQIPALEEVFENFPDRYYLMEIKQVEPSIVPAVLDILATYEVEERVVIASFNQVTIDEVRALSPEQFTAMSAPEMITFVSEGDQPDYVLPCEFIQAPWDFVDLALVELSHELGLKVHPWTINDEPLMQQLLDLGVDGIMTDDPVLLETLLD